jgi:hypothetical protein
MSNVNVKLSAATQLLSRMLVLPFRGMSSGVPVPAFKSADDQREYEQLRADIRAFLDAAA